MGTAVLSVGNVALFILFWAVVLGTVIGLALSVPALLIAGVVLAFRHRKFRRRLAKGCRAAD